MLPTTIAGMVTFFALHAYRRIPAMLNFSLGLHNLLATCKVAEVKLFIQQNNLSLLQNWKV